MPLRRGTSNATKSANISEMVASGHPQNVAVAAAMREADDSKRGTGMAPPKKSHSPVGAQRRPFMPGKM